MNWTVSYYNGKLPLSVFSGNLNDAPRDNVVWIDFTFGGYSYRLQGLDYYFISEHDGYIRAGGWYTNTDITNTGYECSFHVDGLMTKERFIQPPEVINPFVGVMVPQPDSIILGLE